MQTSNEADNKDSGVDKEKKLNSVHGKEYRTKINNEILNDHGVCHQKSLADELIFEPASNVVKGSDKHSWIMS